MNPYLSTTPRQPTDADRTRFMAKVQVRSDGCWQWTSTKDPYGYPYFNLDYRKARAHRLAYAWAHPGESIDGLTIDHLCRNTSCVNPDHLEPVTMWENTKRGSAPSVENATKTHCKHGHPFDEANTGRAWNKRDRAWTRYCKACRRDYARRRTVAKGGSNMPSKWTYD